LLFSNLSIDALLPYGTVGFAFAYGVTINDLSQLNRTIARQWHGDIMDRFRNVANLYRCVMEHQLQWQMPEALLNQLRIYFQRLEVLVTECESGNATSNMRTERNTLLKLAVKLCLTSIKIWAYGKYDKGEMTADDVHSLGFLLLGENGGSHIPSEPTRAIAEIKVEIISYDAIHTTIDQAANKNAGPVVNGRAPKVKNAVIVITADDGVTEVYRGYTTRLHNDIDMPEGSRGKQFIIKAAFLRHIGDKPRFGSALTFTMPLTTEDLAKGK
jgi:hypothetical protein